MTSQDVEPQSFLPTNLRWDWYLPDPETVALRGTEEGAQIDLAHFLASWEMDLARMNKPLTPSGVFAALEAALIEYGAKPRLIETPERTPMLMLACPIEAHRRTGANGEIALVSTPSGWPRLELRYTTCWLCDSESVSRWWLTCPRCAAGDATPDHNPDHEWLTQERGTTEWWCPDHGWGGPLDDMSTCGAADCHRDQLHGPHAVTGDVSPLAFMLYEVAMQRDRAWATWALRRTRDMRELVAGWMTWRAETGRPVSIRSRASDHVERAIPGTEGFDLAVNERTVLTLETAGAIIHAQKAKGKAKPIAPKAPAFPDVDSVVAWINDQKNDDGSFLVPETATVRKAVPLLSPIEGRPSINAIQEAQPIRRGRALSRATQP